MEYLTFTQCYSVYDELLNDLHTLLVKNLQTDAQGNIINVSNYACYDTSSSEKYITRYSSTQQRDIQVLNLAYYFVIDDTVPTEQLPQGTYNMVKNINIPATSPLVKVLTDATSRLQEQNILVDPATTLQNSMRFIARFQKADMQSSDDIAYSYNLGCFYALLLCSFVMQQICPTFCFTMGPYFCSRRVPLIIQECVGFPTTYKGRPKMITTLSQFSNYTDINDHVMMDTFLQLLFSISCLQAHNLGHYDLKTENVVIKKVKLSRFVYVLGTTQQESYLNCPIETEYIPMIIDFDTMTPLSSATSKFNAYILCHYLQTLVEYTNNREDSDWIAECKRMMGDLWVNNLENIYQLFSRNGISTYDDIIAKIIMKNHYRKQDIVTLILTSLVYGCPPHRNALSEYLMESLLYVLDQSFNNYDYIKVMVELHKIYVKHRGEQRFVSGTSTPMYLLKPHDHNDFKTMYGEDENMYILNLLKNHARMASSENFNSPDKAKKYCLNTRAPDGSYTSYQYVGNNCCTFNVPKQQIVDSAVSQHTQYDYFNPQPISNFDIIEQFFMNPDTVQSESGEKRARDEESPTRQLKRSDRTADSL